MDGFGSRQRNQTGAYKTIATLDGVSVLGGPSAFDESQRVLFLQLGYNNSGAVRVPAGVSLPPSAAVHRLTRPTPATLRPPAVVLARSPSTSTGLTSPRGPSSVWA